MNRPHDTGLFEDIISSAREARPDLEVRTSFIIGYPTEAEEDFEALETFMKKVQIDKLALFRYSHENGTPAATKYEDVVPEDVKVHRINSLRSTHLDLRKPVRERLAGKIEQVLVDEVTSQEIIARRRQDSPDIDEVVFINKDIKSHNISVADLIEVELHMPMEYDWIGFLNDHP